MPKLKAPRSAWPDTHKFWQGKAEAMQRSAPLAAYVPYYLWMHEQGEGVAEGNSVIFTVAESDKAIFPELRERTTVTIERGRDGKVVELIRDE